MAAVAPAEMTTEKPAEAEKPLSEQTNESSEPAVLKLTGEGTLEETPPLTYIDFLPQCFGCPMEGSEPKYAEFQSVVEQANQWLRSMPQFSAVKCESIDHKLGGADLKLDADSCFQHFSSHGKNAYVKGLRLWLMPKTDTTVPTQQLAYVTVLPEHSSDNLTQALAGIKAAAMRINTDQIFTECDSLATTVEKMNRHFQQKPLPGRILTVETVVLKGAESDKTDQLSTEDTFWSENGKASRLFVYAIRIYYVVGQPVFETIGYHDEIPEFTQSPDGMALRVRFAPFSKSVAKTALWLQEQQGIKIVNLQSVTVKTDRRSGSGPIRVRPEEAGFAESLGLTENRYVKVMRAFYVREVKPDPNAGYASTQLTSRLFVPTKLSTRSFESFSKNMQRVIAWLNATGTPILGMETVRYPFSPDHDSGANAERTDSVVYSHSGQYNITCVRLYFPRQFQEPPPELLPETAEDGWGWACVVS